MLVWYLIFIAGFIFTKGSFVYFDIFILLAALISLPICLFVQQKKPQLLLSLIKPAACLVLLTVLSLHTYGGLYQSNFVFLSYFLLFISILLSLVLLITQNLSKIKLLWGGLFLSAILLRLLMVWASPNPHIDVFDFLKNGALGILSGQNPYSMTYTSMYQGVVPNYYPYPPATLLLTAPSVWLLDDPRYSMIAAEVVVSLVILKVLKKKPEKYIYSLLLLFNPLSPFVIEQSFTEPLILSLLAVVFLLINQKKYLWTAIFFGVALAFKQYLILLWPLFFRLISVSKKEFNSLLVSLITASLIIIPFFVWQTDDFTHDVILYQFNVIPFGKSLTLSALLSEIKISLNPFLGYLIILAAGIMIYKQRIKTKSGFLYLSSFLLFCFFFFNKWASVNYYYLIAQLFLLGVVLEDESDH